MNRENGGEIIRRTGDSFRTQKRAVIARVMGKGGAVRQMIHESGKALDTQSWQGRPGEEVVREVIALAASLPLPDNPGVADRRTKTIAEVRSAVEAAFDNPPHNPAP